MTSVPASAASRSSRGEHHHAADPLVEVAPADADRLGHARTRAMDQAAHLLEPGTGRADQPDRAAPDGIGETRAARRRGWRSRNPAP